MKLRPASIVLILTITFVRVAFAQTPSVPSESPREVLESLWKIAASGDILTPEGWKRAGANYVNPAPWTGNKTVLVMSNDYAFDSVSTKGAKLNAAVTCEQLGQIDSALRYTLAPPSPYFKSGLGYDFETVPSHMLFIGPDGKKEDRTNPKLTYWKIVGPQGTPWTTVNGAIRYVLEMQRKTTDPKIRSNADRSLAMLLKQH